MNIDELPTNGQEVLETIPGTNIRIDELQQELTNSAPDVTKINWDWGFWDTPPEPKEE